MGPNDSTAVCLGDVAEDLTVGHVGSMATEYVPSGVPFLRSQNVEPFRINFSDVKFITHEFHERLAKSALRPGDVVIVRTGKPGTAAVIPSDVKELNCSDLVIVRPGPRLDPRFLCYYINGVSQQHIDANLVGAVQQHFNVGSARNMPIRLPTLAVQQSIANTLGTLDEKIELNRNMNATLEALVRALFKSWFVDFDPVRSKAAGHAPSGMDSETANLFPSEIVESELGPTPKSWRVATIADVAELNPESWSRSTYPASVRYVDLSGTKWGRIESTEVFERDSAPSRAQRILRRGDTIVGTVRPGNGSYSMVGEDGLTGSTGFAVLRPKSSDARAFVYLASTRQENIERLAHLADGGAYPAVRPEVVAQTTVVVPPSAILTRFEQVVGGFLDRAEANNRESTSLANLRDTLLPKLLSGTICIGGEAAT